MVPSARRNFTREGGFLFKRDVAEKGSILSVKTACDKGEALSVNRLEFDLGLGQGSEVAREASKSLGVHVGLKDTSQ